MVRFFPLPKYAVKIRQDQEEREDEQQHHQERVPLSEIHRRSYQIEHLLSILQNLMPVSVFVSITPDTDRILSTTS